KPPPEFPLRLQRLAASAVLVLALGAAVQLARTRDAMFERSTATRALAAVGSFSAKHPDARILADDESASALLWLYPWTARHVGFDVRVEQYSRPQFEQWARYLTTSSPGWAKLTHDYDVLVAAREGP